MFHMKRFSNRTCTGFFLIIFIIFESHFYFSLSGRDRFLL
ncbi:hypothetical protein LEP1GSC104_4566 [Leptospira interrogans str. UI 12621]|uniref:Uncharacterized protein n=3 Tax=Leptospira interrogans TaxID=173 RepID=A0A0E2D479_LEPIR|nr:hypothetical protein LEP1GSC080_4239 [Leptospira interrogans str. FPW2026]EKO25587.1 hypothetical protein LEP1GSC104_4566 [Leptospira interrogans str. UI 12621]EKR54394.1 hypothetical protein LEP1GSC105_3104 [Leptospira interrogans str. UI 12758]EMM93857.1 hypothetical protein LEP1GSC158_4664 [Leptospira interrogans serovar Zanoni str. LT2156]